MIFTLFRKHCRHTSRESSKIFFVCLFESMSSSATRLRSCELLWREWQPQLFTTEIFNLNSVTLPQPCIYLWRITNEGGKTLVETKCTNKTILTFTSSLVRFAKSQLGFSLRLSARVLILTSAVYFEIDLSILHTTSVVRDI